MLKQLHLSHITLTLSLGHIKYLEIQKKIFDILVNSSERSTRKLLFGELEITKLMNLNDFEGDSRSLKVIMSEFLKKTSVDFYLAELHGGFEVKQGFTRKANKLWVFNMKDKSLKKTALKTLEKSGVMNWLVEKNEKNYRELIAYKLERENEFSTFTNTNPEFRSLERQICELNAWQEAFADWFLDSGYELPKWGPEEGMLEMKAETPTEEKDKTTKKKRKKEYSDEEMANLYLNYINKTGDKNPTAERLGDNSNPGLSTWHRRLTKPSFQQLLGKKFEVMGEHLVHLEKTSAKKSPHIRREIPKSHKESSFDELHEKEQIDFNNPIEEIDNRIDVKHVQKMDHKECIELILKHAGHLYDYDELEDEPITDLRIIAKVLLKKE